MRARWAERKRGDDVDERLSGYLPRHILFAAAGIFVSLALPFFFTGYFKNLVSGADAVSSATVVLDQPSGDYIVLINRAIHENEDNLRDWITFFSGGDILYIFEDISCSVAMGDDAGLDMAKSFQSRLPENQMSIKMEDATMLCSRVECEKYDIVIMSREFAKAYQLPAFESANTESIDLNTE